VGEMSFRFAFIKWHEKVGKWGEIGPNFDTGGAIAENFFVFIGVHFFYFCIELCL
jgi:hypothetical protein